MRPGGTVLYIAVVALAAFLAMVGQFRTGNIFACPAQGYGTDRYLAYCQGEHYGDYDHGAFWFGLEPAADASLRNAQVIFLGNSRLQWALSTPDTARWFDTVHARYYLFGFDYDETYPFEAGILQRLKPHAKVYVINLDAFFRNSPSAPARLVMQDRDALRRYEAKRLWQPIHRFTCATLPALCGNQVAFFRSRATGGYFGVPGPLLRVAVSQDPVVDDARVAQGVASGAAFLVGLPVPRSCVITTLVPTNRAEYATAAAIAARLQTRFVSPVVAGLYTADGSHLDSASARRWSQAFLEQAGAQIEGCLAQPDRLTTVARSGRSD